MAVFSARRRSVRRPRDPHRFRPLSVGLALLPLLACDAGSRSVVTPDLAVDRPFAVDWTRRYPDFSELAFVDAQRGWATSSEGIFHTTDGGRSWRRQRARAGYLGDVVFLDDSTGWAVGQEGVLATRDGGRSWTLQAEPGLLHAVTFVDADHGRAVGTGGLVVATRDGGTTWTSQTSGVTAALRAVHFVDRDHGWAAGTQGVVLHTRDGGATWQAQDAGVSTPIADVFFLDRRTGWLAHRDGVLGTTDGGATWAPLVQDSAAAYSRLHFRDAGTGWAVARGGIRRTSDGGATWTPQPAPTGSRAAAIQFFGERHGWIAGSDGLMLATSDGGASWQDLRPAAPPYRGLRFNDAGFGFGLDGLGSTRAGEGYREIRLTEDHGHSWRTVATPAAAHVVAAHFLDARRGWALDLSGSVHRTDDGGAVWRELGRVAARADVLFFLDERTGWAASVDALLASTDGGSSWRQLAGGPAGVRDLFFHDADIGWAVTADGEVWGTGSGGRSWQRLSGPEPSLHLSGLAFANATTGWAVGTVATAGERVAVLLSTHTGGAVWDREYLPLETPEAVAFSGDSIAWITSPFEASDVLIGRPVGLGPGIARFAHVEEPTGGVRLEWTADDLRPAAVETMRLDFCAGARDHCTGPTADWTRIELGDRLRTHGDGRFEAAWDPAERGIGAGTPVHYRVTLRNDAGLVFAQALPHAFVYRPLWTRLPAGVRAGALAAAAMAAYLALATTLLFTRPLALLWAHQHVPVRELMGAALPGRIVGIGLGALLDGLGLSRFAAHARTRRAWAAAYRAGRRRFADLPEPLRPRFVADPVCLDAWVERRAAAAAAAFARIDTVQQRRVYIDLPVQFGARESSRAMSQPKQRDLSAILARPVAAIAIVGEGGCGKSSLACRIGTWAVADDRQDRIAPHRMLPVFLEDEIPDLVAAVANQLRRMVGADEVEDDVVSALLRHKRLLVIVDALSERSPATQHHVASMAGLGGVNALIVTSRRLPDFGPIPVAPLWPERVALATLVPFMLDYLQRTGAGEDFPGRDALHLADRLLALVERGARQPGITPLLVTLFIDQAVALRRAGAGLDELPVSTPDVMLDYVRRTNPHDADVPNRVPDDVIIAAARIVASVSLADHVPRDIRRDDADAALDAHRVRHDGADIVRRLVDNGVLEERDRGGTRFLRFDLDPVAEYLAVLYRLDAHQNDVAGWQQWLDRLAATPGFPAAVEGLVAAVEDCTHAFAADFGLATASLPWKDAVHA